MHKQIPGLKDQLGLVKFQLGEVTRLEGEAPKAAAGAPFPVVMSATAVGLCLKQARTVLEDAASLITAEIAFFEDADSRLSELQEKGEDESARAEIESLTREVAAREAITAGTAVYCMQAVPAAIVFMAKGMEKARSYRS